MVANINKQIQSKIKCRVLSAGEIKSIYKNKYSVTTVSPSVKITKCVDFRLIIITGRPSTPKSLALKCCRKCFFLHKTNWIFA